MSENRCSEMFDWGSVPDVNALDLERWKGTTGEVEREFPLQVALQVHDETIRRFVDVAKMDPLEMAECRGALKALTRFCQVYAKAIGRNA